MYVKLIGWFVVIVLACFSCLNEVCSSLVRQNQYVILVLVGGFPFLSKVSTCIKKDKIENDSGHTVTQEGVTLRDSRLQKHHVLHEILS